MAMKIRVVDSRAIKPFSDTVGCHGFGRPLLLSLSGQHVPPKCWLPATSLHDVITQKNLT
jgi:hypothetical protein